MHIDVDNDILSSVGAGGGSSINTARSAETTHTVEAIHPAESAYTGDVSINNELNLTANNSNPIAELDTVALDVTEESQALAELPMGKYLLRILVMLQNLMACGL